MAGNALAVKVGKLKYSFQNCIELITREGTTIIMTEKWARVARAHLSVSSQRFDGASCAMDI